MTGSPAGESALPPLPAPEWRLPGPPDLEAIRHLSQELSLPRSICGILAARDLTDPQSAKRFLRPRLEDLHPPSELIDLDRAADRILSAVAAGETILVHGDYDVDGVCAAALLTLWIRRLGGTVVPFVPHRLRDGYDLSGAGIRVAAEAGASLIVTCDSGTVAHEAVNEARNLGIEVIVTDHHMPSGHLPAALAVVNPSREDSRYPSPQLCGTGVVFKLCQGLGERAGVPREELWPHLDLVVLATVADLVPLTGENRVLVRFGLRYLAHTVKPGLRALIRAAGLKAGSAVDAGQVGFVLGPRINAVGRLGDANIALRLMLTEDPDEADRLAETLEQTNRQRREEDRATLHDAVERLAAEFDASRDFGVVLSGEGWHPGVIGIVASRLVERIHRPVILIAMQGDEGRGSARSIPDVHLLRAIEAGSEHLKRFGGHAQAAGLEVSRERLPEFRRAFNESVCQQLQGRLPRPRLGGDHEIEFAEATDDLHRLIEYVGPFGIGNRRPVFWAKGLEVVGAPKVVGEHHLKLRLGDGTNEMEAIGFGLAARLPPESLGSGRLEVLFQLKENEYRGRRTLQARILDLRPVGNAPG